MVNTPKKKSKIGIIFETLLVNFIFLCKLIAIPLLYVINFIDYLGWLVVYVLYISKKDILHKISLDLVSFYSFHKRFENLTYEERLNLKDFQLVETKEQKDEKTGESTYYFKRTIIDESFVSRIEIDSMAFLWKFLEKKYGSKRLCFGSRFKLRKKTVFLDEENKQKPWIISEYPNNKSESLVYENFSQVEHDIESLAVGLRHLFKKHLSPKDVQDRVKVCFICDTCREWFVFLFHFFHSFIEKI